MRPDDIANPKYRYTLFRSGLGGTRGNSSLCWVMFNPSTADESNDDPTIRRVIGFTKREGYGSLWVVNLFAARSTKPKHLLEMADPVGPENVATITVVMEGADDVVFAWGASLIRYSDRPPVEGIARQLGLQPKCLGTTRGGHPLHPLYVRGDQPLEVW